MGNVSKIEEMVERELSQEDAFDTGNDKRKRRERPASNKDRESKVFPDDSRRKRTSIMPGKLGVAMDFNAVKNKRKSNIQELFATDKNA